MHDQAAVCSHCGLPVPAGRRGGSSPWFCCFGCRLARQLALPAMRPDSAGDDGPPTTLLLRLGLGIFLAINIMIASWIPYSRDLFGGGVAGSDAESAFFALASYLALFLCTIVMALLGLPLVADSFGAFLAPATATGGKRLGNRVNAQLLIVIGVFSAFLLSFWHTLRGTGSLYYDTAATVLVVVTLGSFLEAGARRRATDSAYRLLADLPRRIEVERAGTAGPAIEVALPDLRPGDRVTVLPGGIVPVDGRVDEGMSRVDEASFTGEPWPRPVAPGDRLLAGSQNHEGLLRVVAERVSQDTVLALMESSLDTARNRRPSIQRLADRVAAVFVPAVVTLALVLFSAHAWNGEPATGLMRALSVLLISCPCALGLAAPLASWHGLRRAAERGILIDSPATLERAAAVRRLYLDKTGTLTRPEAALERLTTGDTTDADWALAAAAALESASTHPIARAVIAAARSHGIEIPRVASAINVPGLGVEGTVEGRQLRLGSGRWVDRLGLDDDGLIPESAGRGRERQEETRNAVYLSDERLVLARFDVEEALRGDARNAIDDLRRQGVAVKILSGDGDGPTQKIAATLELAAEGGLLPDDKVDRLRRARRSGETVGMVGDGVNDAAVLTAADIGIAMGSASDLAKRSGNVRLVSDRLDRIPQLFALARDTRRRIRANLLFAFGFNTIGIALAAAGYLRPVFAAVAMVVSSLVVVRISSGAGRATKRGATTESSESDRPGTGTALPGRPAAAESR